MKRLGTSMAIATLILTASFISGCAQNPEAAAPKSASPTPAAATPDKDKKEAALQLKDLPAAVQKTIAAETKGGQLVGLSTEKENKQTLYEAEFKIDGRGKNLLIDASGAVAEVESEVELSELQPAIRTAMQKAAGKSKIVLVESLTRKNKSEGYEIQLQDSDGKKSEVTFDVSGRRKEAEKEDEEEDDDDNVKK